MIKSLLNNINSDPLNLSSSTEQLIFSSLRSSVSCLETQQVYTFKHWATRQSLEHCQGFHLTLSTNSSMVMGMSLMMKDSAFVLSAKQTQACRAASERHAS